MHDAADHPPVVDTPRSRVHHRQVWLDLRPLHIAQPEQARHGPSLAVCQGESTRRTDVNRVQTLAEDLINAAKGRSRGLGVMQWLF
jgi:hypothetical protein